MRCEFDANNQCSRCGFVARKLRTIRTCPAAPDDDATQPLAVFELAGAYLTATAEWIAAGRPTRDALTIAGIVDGICSQCDKFSGSSCSICGCVISRSPSALRNMVAMATKHCPLEKW